ncbi:MAG: PAS domain-containing hybrid sensor histidine kinase/response regulator [Thermodesulfobacteriota bacterium]
MARTAELIRTNRQLKLEIRDRRRVEEALRKSEERYRALFEHNPIGAIIVDQNARVIGYNLAKSETDSRVPKIGDIMYQDYAGKHRIDMLAELKDCIRSGIPKEFPELQYNDTFLHIRISPISGGAIITSIDITDRKKVEEALRESEKRYRDLVETIPHGIQEIDLEGRITFANSALEKILGYRKNALIGRSILDVMAVPMKRGEMLRLLKKMAEDESLPIPYFLKCRKPNGADVDIKADWNYKCNPSGKVIGFTGVITDITNQLRAEEEKEKLESRLRYAHKMEAIGTLAGGIAHDFNNILGSILLNTELALDDVEEGSETAYSLEQVIRGSHRAKDLIEQILTFSRRSDVESKPLKINTLMKETLKMLRAMFPSTIVIHQEIEERIDPVMADPDQIQQLVINLCNNAAQSMHAGGGTLNVSLTNTMLHEPPSGSDLMPGRYVRIAVKDGGCGIQQDIKDRIFDPFFTTKQPGEGAGLGLSVVHGIVINHKGGITVSSKPGEGTTIEVLLPVFQEKDEHESPGASAEPPLGMERILFVDDEEVVVDANKRILERLGYHVTAATNGQEALDLFRKAPDAFDLVITDMTMPSMTGIELAGKMIRIKPSIPVILCTGYSQFMTIEQANALGIREFIMKPSARKEIAAVIRRVLDISPSLPNS